MVGGSLAVRGWSCLRSCGMWRLLDADYCGVAWLVVVALNDVAAFSDVVRHNGVAAEGAESQQSKYCNGGG